MRSFLYPYLKIIKKCPAIRCESRYSVHIQLKFLIQNSNLSVKDEFFIKLPLLQKNPPLPSKMPGWKRLLIYPEKNEFFSKSTNI